MADSQVKIELTVEERQALAAVSRLNRELTKLEATAVETGESTDASFARGTSSVTSLGGALTKSVFLGNLAAEAFQVVAGAVKDFVVGSVAAAQEQENAINRLSQALRASGDFSQEAVDDFSAFASELQRTSVFGDEVVISQLALAKSFGASNSEAKALVQAAANLSATFGGDLEGNVEKLGKTLNGSIGKLGQFIPELKTLTKEQLAAGAATDLINQKFGGAAAAQLDTYSGKVTALTNALSDMQEEIGTNVTESGFVADAVGVLTTLFQDFTKALADSRIEQKRQNGELVESTSSLDQLKRKYEELQVAAIDAEQIIINPSLFDTLLARPAAAAKNLELLKQQISATAAEITKAEADIAASAAAAAEAKKKKPKPAEVVDDQIIQQRRQQGAELKALDKQIEAEREIQKEELRLASLELNTVNNKKFITAEAEAALIRNEAAYQAELQKNALIENAQNQRQANEIASRKKLLADEAAYVQASVALKRNQNIQEQQVLSTRLNAAQGFLSAGLTLAKQGSKEQQALQIAQATISTFTAANQALSSPPGPPFTLPLVAAVVAQGLANVAKISGVGFEDGGIVPGSSNFGDRVPVRVNSGEMILNKQQQANLFEQANGGGGNDSIMAAIMSLGDKIQNMTLVVQADGREIARLVRDERNGGFAV